MRLRDKVIIVTGAASGIGRAIAQRCLAEGARVLVHAREEAEGRRVVDELAGSVSCRAQPKEAVELCVADLAEASAAVRVVEAAVVAFGRIDGLVNNAAAIVRSTLESTTAAFFDQVMAVNVRAPLLLIQAALQALRESRASVVNIGSVNAYSGEAGLLDYSISKGALMTLSRNLANALGRDEVRVNHINPGWVLTENEYELQRRLGMPADWPRHVPPEYAPSGRLIAPEAIAAAVVYWLSDESRPITGSVVELEQFSIMGRNPNKV